MDFILQPFTRDLKILASQGITMQIGGRDCMYHGAFLADNLASHMLGSFKGSFPLHCNMSHLYGYMTNTNVHLT